MTVPSNDAEPAPSGNAEPAPGNNRRVLWLVGAAAVAVGIVVLVLVMRDSGPSLTADEQLERALLTDDEYPSAYTVSVLTQEQLDEAANQQELPDNIEPARCGELLESQPQPSGDYSVGGAMASSGDTYYVEMVTPAASVGDLDPAKSDEVLAACESATVSQDGQTATINLEKLPPLASGDESYAMKTVIEAGGVTISLGLVVTKIGDYAVAFSGATNGGEFDDTEFTELASAANDKVRDTLG